MATKLGATLALGATLGWWMLPSADEGQVSLPEKLLLDQHLLNMGENAESEALATIRSRLGSPFQLIVNTGPHQQLHPVSAAQLGVEIDRTRLRQLLHDAASPTSPTNLQRSRLGLLSPGKPMALFTPIRLNTPRAVSVLLSLKRKLDQAPRDARLNPLGGPPLTETIGRILDVDASLLAIERSLENGQLRAELVFRTSIPSRLASHLAGIEQSTTLGRFSTPYDRSRKAQARTFNLRLAASQLDGTVLLPNDVFDFNAVVGPRDEAHGYQVASVIAQGEVVDGIGGGTCQISGTLHAAALLAGLEIIERTPHTRPSSYIKLGFDATVVYPTINLRLRNPYDFPVVLHETVNDGKVEVLIVGPERPHRITIIRKIDEGKPFSQIERPDASLPKGTRVVSQRGVPGLTLHRYRVVETGVHSVREKIVDRYPPTAEVTRVGTGDETIPASAKAKSVGAEYLPDELLVLSQQLDPDAPVLITRRPGRYGQPGWSANLVESEL